MIRLILMMSFSFILSGCFLLDEEQPLPTFEESSVAVTSDTDGDSSISLSISRISYNAGTNGPTFVAIEATLPPSALIEVELAGIEILEFTSSTDCITLPAFDQPVCQPDVFEKMGIVVPNSGTVNLEVFATSGANWRSESFSAGIQQGSCESNSTVYEDKMQPILQSSCISCHSNGGNAGYFSASESWDSLEGKLKSAGDTFYKYPSGEELGHERTNLFSQYGATYRLFAEMLWRANNDFVCP